MVYSKPIDMSPRTLSTWFLVLFALLLVFLSFWIFWPFLTPIAWAVILSRVFYGPHERLASFVKEKRAVSALITTIGVMGLVVLPLSYVTAVAASELMHLYEVAREWIESGGLAKLPGRLAELPLMGPDDVVFRDGVPQLCHAEKGLVFGRVIASCSESYTPRGRRTCCDMPRPSDTPSS